MRFRLWGKLRESRESGSDEPEGEPKDSSKATISSDQPIHRPEEDQFGVDPFARMVAQNVAGQKAAVGTVIGVHGPWGGGKSSVLNLVVHHLKEIAPHDIEVVQFSPWWFTGSPSLTRAFLSVIASVLNRSLKDEGREAPKWLLEASRKPQLVH